MRFSCSILALLLLSACSQNIPQQSDPAVSKAEGNLKSADGSEGEIQTVSATSSENVYQVKFETTKGDFIVEVTRDLAPIGADRFRELVEVKFFDGCRFFRVLPGFVAQVGMNGDPATHKKWSSKNLKDEPVKASNSRGTLTFAKTQLPNTRSTQLFINYGNNKNLDRMGFSPFGKVIKGMEVVDSFYSGYGERPDQGRIKSSGNDYLKEKFPKLDYIKKATILKKVP